MDEGEARLTTSPVSVVSLGVESTTRRTLLVAGLATLVVPIGLAQDKPRPPALADELVREFVGAGHGNLEKVKSMLAEHPGLLNATWDWGGGDWESAIGGAGHMGRADIAGYLIEQGARVDIFVAAMLGQLDVVKGMIAAMPAQAKAKGPHGISLRRHAEKGGEAAKPVLAYLESLPG